MAEAGIAISPPAGMGIQQASETAFAHSSRIAVSHKLEPFESLTTPGEQWRACYVRDRLFLCQKIYGPEIQFLIYETISERFTSSGQRLVQEMTDSLRVIFGEERVRECKWRYETAKRSGCEPLRKES